MNLLNTIKLAILYNLNDLLQFLAKPQTNTNAESRKEETTKGLEFLYDQLALTAWKPRDFNAAAGDVIYFVVGMSLNTDISAEVVVVLQEKLSTEGTSVPFGAFLSNFEPVSVEIEYH